MGVNRISGPQTGFNGALGGGLSFKGGFFWIFPRILGGLVQGGLIFGGFLLKIGRKRGGVLLGGG